jgi:tetratricopeptide (TPR) repeat protein
LAGWTTRFLGPLDERGREIGAEGARRLSSAGRRAFARGDIPGAVTLLRRAAALLPADDAARIWLLPDYGEALLLTGRYEDATAALDEAMGHAGRVPAAAARASLIRLLVRLRTGGPDEWRRDAIDAEIAAAMRVFEAEGDEAGLAMAYRLLAWSAGTACRYGDAAEANLRALEHARRAGDVRQERRAITGYAGATSLGPTNVDDAIARCEEGLETTAGDRQSEGNLLAVLGGLYALQGAFDHARDLIRRARSLLDELGLDMDVARAGIEAWRTELLAGDLEAAEEELRSSYEMLDTHGERYVLSTVAGLLAQTLLERGAALDEAWELAERSKALATEGDIATQALWRCAQGRALARRGSIDEGERLVRQALEILEPTDQTVLKLDASVDLGEVLVAADRLEEAREAYEVARRYAESKGGVVVLGAVLRRLESLDATLA